MNDKPISGFLCWWLSTERCFFGPLPHDLGNDLVERKVVSTYGWHMLRVDSVLQLRQYNGDENDVAWSQISMAFLGRCGTGMPAQCDATLATVADNDLTIPDVSLHCIANTTTNSDTPLFGCARLLYSVRHY
jgi:hypothetical protein